MCPVCLRVEAKRRSEAGEREGHRDAVEKHTANTVGHFPPLCGFIPPMAIFTAGGEMMAKWNSEGAKAAPGGLAGRADSALCGTSLERLEAPNMVCAFRRRLGK